jgi:hypothetical protein
MAAALLRHYANSLGTTGLTSVLTVPTARALVIGKIVISCTGAATFGAYTTASGGGLGYTFLPLQAFAANSIYTESGLVLTAGESLLVNISSVASNVFVQVFGEEVDN